MTRTADGRLAGRKALVTGGSRGIGAAGLVHIERPPEEFVARGALFHGVQLWINS